MRQYATERDERERRTYDSSSGRDVISEQPCECDRGHRTGTACRK